MSHCFFPEIGPASVMVGNLVSGKRIAQASGRDLGQIEDNDQARKVRAGVSLGPDLQSQPPECHIAEVIRTVSLLCRLVLSLSFCIW